MTALSDTFKYPETELTKICLSYLLPVNLENTLQ